MFAHCNDHKIIRTDAALLTGEIETGADKSIGEVRELPRDSF